MATKDILKKANLMPTQVGETLYVWTPKGKKPKGERECVISAHGLQTLVTSPDKKPRVPLYFYCPNGFTLEDPSLIRIARGTVKWNEKVDANRAGQDYLLTKYQGRHTDWKNNTQETYATIQTLKTGQQARDEINQFFDEQLRQAEGLVGRFGAEKVQEIKANHERDRNLRLNDNLDIIRDIVTVRCRDRHKPPTLFKAVSLLLKWFDYTAVHCAFCRGPADGGDGQGSWSTSKNQG